MGELVSMVASWSESKEQLIGLFLWVDPLPRARTWTRWGICRCNRVAREGSLLDSARRGYPSSHLPPQTTPKKKVTNNTRRAWDLTARRTASFLLNAPPPPILFMSAHPPFACRQGRNWVHAPCGSFMCLTCCCLKFWFLIRMMKLNICCLRFAAAQSIERHSIERANTLWTNAVPGHFILSLTPL